MIEFYPATVFAMCLACVSLGMSLCELAHGIADWRKSKRKRDYWCLSNNELALNKALLELADKLEVMSQHGETCDPDALLTYIGDTAQKHLDVLNQQWPEKA